MAYLEKRWKDGSSCYVYCCCCFCWCCCPPTNKHAYKDQEFTLDWHWLAVAFVSQHSALNDSISKQQFMCSFIVSHVYNKCSVARFRNTIIMSDEYTHKKTSMCVLCRTVWCTHMAIYTSKWIVLWITLFSDIKLLLFAAAAVVWQHFLNRQAIPKANSNGKMGFCCDSRATFLVFFLLDLQITEFQHRIMLTSR